MVRPDDRALDDEIPQEDYHEEVVEVDLPCARCGLNLRGLEVTGSCPDCGLTIALSMSPALLRLTKRSWVKTLVDGCRWNHWAVMAVFYVVSFGVLSWFLVEKIDPKYSPMYIITGLLALALLGVTWQGYRMITATEPERPGRYHARRWQTLMRITGHVVLIAGIVATAGCFFMDDRIAWLWAAGSMVGLTLLLFWLAAAVLLPVARRVPDVGLWASDLTFLIVTAAIAALATYALQPLHQDEPLVPLDNEFVLSVLLLMPLVAALWAVAIFWTFAKSLSTIIHGKLEDLDDSGEDPVANADTNVPAAKLGEDVGA